MWCRVYDYGETDEVAYIVMEFVDGLTLKALPDQKRRFPIADILRVMDDVLSGPQYIHA
jgi:serine/threonine protein kinase